MSVELLDHTADIALRIQAVDAAELFREALRGFLLILAGERGGEIRPRDEAVIDLRAEDAETLLVDFFNELIFRFDTQRAIFSELRVDSVDLEPERCALRGTLVGETFEPGRHRLETEVKAATFHDLEIVRSPRGLTVDIVLDL